ncbi:MAG TPA: glycosyltransferase family A protein [Stellaceae bacterium]|jgi:glycosyltransferase involved in cell wall biosynthesis|nr:glycosyltransferase family A protein [Stellaceae bacterium]
MTIAPAEPLPDTMVVGQPDEATPSIAVVIPTYNRAHTILRSIESVLAQSLQPAEIIIVDDGSSDGTLDLLRAQPYAGRLKLVQRQNGGGPAARNSGIEAASADWIAFLDSDDAWAPDKLRLQLDRLKFMGPEYGACYCGSVERLETGEVQGKSRVSAEGSIYTDCLSFNVPGSTSCIVARRDLLVEIGGFAMNLPSCQDWDLWLRMASRCKFACVPQILVTLYVGRNDRITANPKGRLRGHLYIYRRYIRPAMRESNADPSMFYWILGNIFMQIDRPYYARRCYILYWQRKKASFKRLAILFTAMSGLRRARFFAVTGLLDRLEARLRPSPLHEALE